jgi:hypothetical protein
MHHPIIQSTTVLLLGKEKTSSDLAYHWVTGKQGISSALASPVDWPVDWPEGQQDVLHFNNQTYCKR